MLDWVTAPPQQRPSVWFLSDRVLPIQVCPRGHAVCSRPAVGVGMPAGDFLLGTDVLLGGSSYGRVAPPLRFRNTGVLGPDSCCLDAIREFWMERRSRGVRWLRGKDVVGGELDSSCHQRWDLGSGSVPAGGRSDPAGKPEVLHLHRVPCTFFFPPFIETLYFLWS